MGRENHIKEMWETLRLGEKLKLLKPCQGQTVTLDKKNISCMKNSREITSLWKLLVEDQDRKNQFPVCLKIYKSLEKEHQQVEMNMYKKAYPLLHDFMPQVYFVNSRVNGTETWLFTEYLQLLKEKIKITPPTYFDYTIPAVAKFHALTFERLFDRQKDIFHPWLPRYHSKWMAYERIQQIEATKERLDEAMRHAHLKAIMEPLHAPLQKILQKGPDFFPELIEAGQTVIHGDLNVRNIGCKLAGENKDRPIQLLDWESAKYAPCWFDIVVLVEIFIDFRKDWHKHADHIRHHCVSLYVKEMQKHGVTFRTKPLHLFKMAYLQRALETKLVNHLRRELRGEKSALLPRYVYKIAEWGKEMGLY